MVDHATTPKVPQNKIKQKYVSSVPVKEQNGKLSPVRRAPLNIGNLKESGVNIEQNCGNNNQTTDGSSSESSEPSDGSTEGTPAPMGSSSVPVKSSSTSTEELKIYEKPAFQIGTVASSSCSIFSCAMLIMLAM